VDRSKLSVIGIKDNQEVFAALINLLPETVFTAKVDHLLN
jgi:hypothetical protein